MFLTSGRAVTAGPLATFAARARSLALRCSADLRNREQLRGNEQSTV